MNDLCTNCLDFVGAQSSREPHPAMLPAGGITISGKLQKGSVENFDCDACGARWSRGMDEKAGLVWFRR
jgi:hypothetical protein